MEHLNFNLEGDQPGNGSAGTNTAAVVVGVVSSGNLEVMVEPAEGEVRCSIEVNTSARGFDHVWAAVLGDFVERSRIAAVRISINDVGATPAVVSLRLDQALEEFRGTRDASNPR
ncbi:MAG: malonate decarboxylase acyl carrier protein [Burkholderiaceae bacterium]